MKDVDWTKWSAIAEIFSAIAIVVTLLYLAVQTNQLQVQTAQNFELMEREAARAVEDRRYLLSDVVLNNPVYLEIMLKDKSELTELEREQMTLLGIRILLNFEALHEDVERGTSTQDYAERVVRNVYWRPTLDYGAKLAWETYKGRAAPEFIEWMDEYVIEPGPIE